MPLLTILTLQFTEKKEPTLIVSDFISESGKRVVNVELNENFDEEKLLYLLNLVINSSSFLLIITRFNITKKKVHLKDLSSRIKSSTTLTIKKFCKKTKNIFIIKLLNDKGYALGDDIINYLTKKLPNNYKDIYLLIENILNNKLTLKEIKKILKM